MLFLFTCSLFARKRFSGHLTNNTNTEKDVNHTAVYEEIYLEDANQKKEEHVYLQVLESADKITH